MKSDRTFSLFGFSLLFRQYWIYHSKLFITSILGLIGGLIVLLYSIQTATRFDTWRYEHFMYLFIALFMVLAIVYAGSSFPGFRSRGKGYSYLRVPATITEKFLFELFTRVVLFIMVVPGLYWSTFYLEGNLVALLNPDFTFRSFSFFEGFNNPIKTENYRHIAYLASQGMLFLTVPFFGATVFMKQPIIKTLAWATGILIAHFIFLYVSQKNDILLFESSKDALLFMTTYFLVVNLIMVVLAYFQLKQKQIS